MTPDLPRLANADLYAGVIHERLFATDQPVLEEAGVELSHEILFGKSARCARGDFGRRVRGDDSSENVFAGRVDEVCDLRHRGDREQVIVTDDEREVTLAADRCSRLDTRARCTLQVKMLDQVEERDACAEQQRCDQ